MLSCTKCVTGIAALRSKWAAGKARRGSISESIRDRGATQPPAHFHRNPPGCASFAWLLCRSSVEDHSGYAPSSLRASSQNTQQRRYTSHGLGALAKHRFAEGKYLNSSSSLSLCGNISGFVTSPHGCSAKISRGLRSSVPQLAHSGDEFQAEFSSVAGRRISLVRRSTRLYRSNLQQGGEDRRLDEMADGAACWDAPDRQSIFPSFFLHQSREPA